LTDATRSEWIVIALAAVFLLGGHPFPFGTIAFGCFFGGAVFYEFRASGRHFKPSGRHFKPSR